MLPSPERPEIDHHTMKLIVGIIALSLALLTNVFSGGKIESVSASYYVNGPTKDIFVGFLFAIGALLASYNGNSRPEMVLSKVAAAMAVLVAIFPCRCGGYPELIPGLHGLASFVMFLILALFCRKFFIRAKTKNYPEAMIRARIYRACGVVIVGMILTLALYYGVKAFTDYNLSALPFRLVFWCETIALVAFGVAWLVASRMLPVLTNPDDRLSPFR